MLTLRGKHASGETDRAIIPLKVPARRLGATALTLLVLLCFGCSPATRRNVASYVFDGYPAPPLPEVYCASWLAAKQGQTSSATMKVKDQGSVHLPYKEKSCTDCHDTTKTGGLVVPSKELCLLCHDYIIKGAYTHAPAVSGNCLTCHLPHDSAFPALLKREKGKLCIVCHVEPRVAPGLHKQVTNAGIVCSDCHNPHAGSTQYFLK
jgi:predicted CXXCH cytochrome family protein